MLKVAMPRQTVGSYSKLLRLLPSRLWIHRQIQAALDERFLPGENGAWGDEAGAGGAGCDSAGRQHSHLCILLLYMCIMVIC